GGPERADRAPRRLPGLAARAAPAVAAEGRRALRTSDRRLGRGRAGEADRRGAGVDRRRVVRIPAADPLIDGFPTRYTAALFPPAFLSQLGSRRGLNGARPIPRGD